MKHTVSRVDTTGLGNGIRVRRKSILNKHHLKNSTSRILSRSGDSESEIAGNLRSSAQFFCWNFVCTHSSYHERERDKFNI